MTDTNPTPIVDNVLKKLQDNLSNTSTGMDVSNLGITLPDLSYPLNGSDTDKKNLNSAKPTIEDMINEFQNATAGGETKFYLGACRSIQAAYDLEMKGITGSDPSAEQAKTRAKLLLNLRKNLHELQKMAIFEQLCLGFNHRKEF